MIKKNGVAHSIESLLRKTVCILQIVG